MSDGRDILKQATAVALGILMAAAAMLLVSVVVRALFTSSEPEVHVAVAPTARPAAASPR